MIIYEVRIVNLKGNFHIATSPVRKHAIQSLHNAVNNARAAGRQLIEIEEDQFGLYYRFDYGTIYMESL